jgi:hypothetical protein
LREAAEQLLGRSLENDEVIGMFTYRVPAQAPDLSEEAWDRELDEIIDSFPQTPILSDEAVSRESIYTREDELL